jgi:FKBP-type peptidyl-prolyl cis-trans isomerase FklB
MRHSASALLTLALFALCVTAGPLPAQDQPSAPQEEAQESASDLKTLKERASYTIGQNLAAQIKFEKRFDLDFDIVIRGFQDALKDQEPALTERERQDAMLELSKKIREESEMRSKALSEMNLKEGEEFLAKNKQREGVITTESGLQYEVLKRGKPGKKPTKQDTVKTHYHGTLIDGTVFDSSVDRGEPISFPVGGVIDGWTEALQLMHVGDKFKLYIPSDLAYKQRGAGEKIGPNTTLIFEVELLGINE